MSTLLDFLNRQSTSASAHPLFLPTQAFLWLPGFSGHGEPFCSYNYGWERGRGETSASPVAEDSGIPLHPAHPVSQASFIAWDITVVPPFPYHPVPVVRPLSPAEMEELARKVTEVSREASGQGVHPVRSENKHVVLAILAQMGLLASKPEPLDVPRVA